MSVVEITKDFTFEAAHWLPNGASNGPLRSLHGHSYRVSVTVRGTVEPTMGWVMDFAEIKAVVQPLIAKLLNHRCLNEVEGLANPTVENLAAWAWSRLRPELPLLVAIAVSGACTPACVYRGE